MIEVARLNGEKRYVVVSDNMDKPKAIVVHPHKGYIYWSDWGTPPKLERANLDGSDRMVVVNSSIQMVTDLAIDFDEDKLYWSDSRLDSIQRSDLDGSNIEVVVGGNLENPFALTVHGDFVYWIDT